MDNPHNRFYVANVNFSAVVSGQYNGFQSSIAAFSLDDKSLIWETDLSTVGGVGVPHFANDVAVDSSGNLYVTDSFGSQIWKVT